MSLILIGKKTELNPRHMLQVGRAKKRSGSPSMFNFKFYSPPELGAGGQECPKLSKLMRWNTSKKMADKEKQIIINL